MPENQNIEYKASWRDEYLKWVCGFANAQGGKIFIGMDDKGKVVGVEDYKKLMDDIPNKTVSHLGVVVDVNLHRKSGRYYLEINVPASKVPVSYHGTYHYRSGSTKQELKGIALQNWLLKKMGMSWEDISIPSATIEDLDGDTITAFIPEPIMKEEQGGVSVTFLKNIYTEKYLQNLNIHERQIKAILYIKEHGEISNTKYQELNNVGKTIFTRDLQDLTYKNLVKQIGKAGRGTKYILINRIGH